MKDASGDASRQLEERHLEQMLDHGGVGTPALRRAAIHLFVADTVKAMVKGPASPLHARRLLDDAVSQSRQVTSQDRRQMIHALHARFGMEALVRQLNYLGERMQGVELPAEVAALGHRPSIRLDGRTVFEGRASVVKDMYEALAGREGTSDAVVRHVALWCGIERMTGTLSLHRDDGETVASTPFAGPKAAPSPTGARPPEP